MNKGAVYLPTGAGPCAKVVVEAVLVTPDGDRFTSTNFCMKPQSVCPRETQGYGPGKGYHLCEEVCDQLGHAEVNVIKWAKLQRHEGLEGSSIYVNYSWVCDNCKDVAALYGCCVHQGTPPVAHTQRQWTGYERSRAILLGS